MFNHTLSAILRGHWFLDKAWADAHLPLVISILNGNSSIQNSGVERTGSQMELPFVVDPRTMQRHNLYVYDRDYNIVPNPNIPKGSVGVLPITGPVTKYNGDCGEPGAINKNSYLIDMQRRENISGIVLLSDTPGGEAAAAPTLTASIKNSKKPVLTYVDGMTASLGVWFSSASREVWLANDMSSVGSVGSYTTLFDFSGALEKAGIRMHEIYAPQSTDKNKDYNAALQGDYSGMKSHLEFLTNTFITSVKANRPKAAAKEKHWNTGKMFTGSDAVKAGLADGIMPFEKVISRAAFLANQTKTSKS